MAARSRRGDGHALPSWPRWWARGLRLNHPFFEPLGAIVTTSAASVRNRGAGRELRPGDQVDEIVDHYPGACGGVAVSSAPGSCSRLTRLVWLNTVVAASGVEQQRLVVIGPCEGERGGGRHVAGDHDGHGDQ